MSIQIAIVEDDQMFQVITKNNLAKIRAFNIRTYATGKEFLTALENKETIPDIVILDNNLPDYNGIELLKKIKIHNEDIAVILTSGQQDVNVVVEAYDNDAVRYIVKNKATEEKLAKTIKKLASQIDLKHELLALKDRNIVRSEYSEIIGECDELKKVFRILNKAKTVNIPTLIVGESGTGKELIANALHNDSGWKKKPFVAVNVAAIPDDLIEAELFGYEKGAFTGASNKRIGKFEEANGGTLFLDEIGELKIELQSKLLRVIQENKVSRIGSNKELPLEFKLVTATNKNLKQMADEGKFREDLYYRISGLIIPIPALRKRENDVILLIQFFTNKFCNANNLPKKPWSNDAIQTMKEYNWPGNIRELKNVVERAVLLSENNEIMPEDILF